MISVQNRLKTVSGPRYVLTELRLLCVDLKNRQEDGSVCGAAHHSVVTQLLLRNCPHQPQHL